MTPSQRKAGLEGFFSLFKRGLIGIYQHVDKRHLNRRIELDAGFVARSNVIAAKKVEQELPTQWFEGVSLGTVIGSLRQVSDIEGEQQFVIIPPIGADRITCTFPEEKRELMQRYLFKGVRVHGRLRYGRSSPFPFAVDMVNIEPIVDSPSPLHLLDLRGLFKGRESLEQQKAPED